MARTQACKIRCEYRLAADSATTPDSDGEKRKGDGSGPKIGVTSGRNE